jgi:Beta protein
MSQQFLYAPIIKGKRNDICAMAHVRTPVADLIKPIFELPPFLPTDKPEEKLAKFAGNLSRLFASGRDCYVDFPLLKTDARTSDGTLALVAAYGQFNALNINFEPVYGFDRDDGMWPIVMAQAKKSKGMLLRLDLDDMEFAEDTVSRIQDLSTQNLKTSNLDIMLDCRYINDASKTEDCIDAASLFVEKLAKAINFRKLIIAGSSAPKTVAEIDKDSQGVVLRRELILWARLRAMDLPYEPIYSDYGVIHPDFSDLKPSKYINGKIRYTHGANMNIFRGHGLRDDDKFEQYRSLAMNVMQSGLYSGNSYSHGDRYIYDCASGQAKTGNPGVWVLNDQNHHFTYAAKQIEQLDLLAYRGYTAEALLAQA